jgi:hypothetical protein
VGVLTLDRLEALDPAEGFGAGRWVS